MASFGILHLTDLHYGLKQQKDLLPGVLANFYADLKTLHDQSGPWDLVLFSGDLVQSGQEIEFRELQKLLDDLWMRLRSFGSDPILLAVPGNHDLVRPDADLPEVLILQDLATSKLNRTKVWEDLLSTAPPNRYRNVLKEAFQFYSAWWEQCPYCGQDLPDLTYHAGPLPGDFSAILEKEGVRLGIVGLNTTFLQLTDGNCKGKLALSVQQFNDACDGEGALWFENNIDACVLMTHQPPSWLAKSNRQVIFDGEIDLPGRFAAHFCGHMHVPDANTRGKGWAQDKRLIRGGSLFGLEIDAAGNRERIHAYSACRIEIPDETAKGGIRLWPRIATARMEGHLEFDRDTKYSLDRTKDDGGTRPQEFDRLRKLQTLNPAMLNPVTPPQFPEEPSRVLLGRLWNVPAFTGNIVDRPEFSGGVRDCLLSPSSRKSGVLVASAIQGQGGIGKTVLAQLLAQDPLVRAHFSDGIYWLPFGQEPNVLSSLGDLIQVFDPNFKISTLQAASAHLQGLFSDKCALLILDDAWEQKHIQPFLVGGEKCRFLMTTRRCYVAEDVNAQLFSLDVMTQEQALELFENGLSRRLDASERHQSLQLASAVGFLPLALNLAVARVREGATSWHTLTQDLQQEVARLETMDGARRLLSDQVSLEASLLLSLRSLQSKNPKTRELFAWLGVLPEDVIITPPMMATLWQMEEGDAKDHLELFWKEALLLAATPVSLEGQIYPCYRLHDLFHDMARRLLMIKPPQGFGLSQITAHQFLLERYKEHSLMPQGKEGGWAKLKADGYIHQHLMWHMEKAGRIEWMVSLLQEETLNGQNAWYQAKERLGQTGGYLEDVRRIWKLVQEKSLQNHERGEAITNLGLELRFVLIVASLNSLAANLPSVLLENLVRHGIWQPKVGLDYIGQMPSAQQRSEALIAIASFLKTEQLQRALTIARDIKDLVCCIQTLIGLAPYLSDVEEQVQILLEALSITRALENISLRSHLLADIATSLALLDKTDQALSISKEITSAFSRAQALTGISVNITEVEQRTQILTEALTIAKGLANASSRTKALKSIVTSLALTAKADQALAIISEIKDTFCRAECLASVVSTLSTLGEIGRALLVTKEIEEVSSRSQVLASIATSLATAGEIRRALLVAREIKDISFRAQALIGISVHMAEAEKRTQILIEALSVARKIKDISSRSQALTSIATSLATAGEIDRALSVAREIEGAFPHTQALTNMVGALRTAGEIDRALSVAKEIKDISFRSQVLTSIATSLTPDEIGQALPIIRDIEVVHWRAKALATIALQLSEVSSGHFLPAWNTLLQMSALQTRRNVQVIITQLLLVLLKRGNIQTMDEVIKALHDVARWWP